VKEPIGCGISWLWILPKDHPFIDSCSIHDKQYDMRISGENNDLSSYSVDRAFLASMLSKAGDSLKLRAQAYLFYGLARTWGKFRWPTGGK